MAEIIERRRSGIQKVADLFTDVHEIGVKFNEEVHN